MSKHYRDCIAWTKGRSPHKEDLARETLDDFVGCFYARAILLRKDTFDVLQAYASKSKDFHNTLSNEMNRIGNLEGKKTTAMDLLNETIGPAYHKVEKQLRDEMGIKHPWYLRPFGDQSES
jgi:hypothetical protein